MKAAILLRCHSSSVRLRLFAPTANRGPVLFFWRHNERAMARIRHLYNFNCILNPNVLKNVYNVVAVIELLWFTEIIIVRIHCYSIS
jgi:hypothetical protein